MNDPVTKYNILRKKLNTRKSEAENLKGKLAYVEEELDKLGVDSVSGEKELKVKVVKLGKVERSRQDKLDEAEKLLIRLE
jgi:hypothetical protein